MGSEVLQARRSLEPAGAANLVAHYHIQTDLIPSSCSFLLSCNRAASSLIFRHRHLQQPRGVAHIPHCTCGCEVCTCTPPQIVTVGAQETPSPSEPESQEVHKQEDTTSLRCGDMWPNANGHSVTLHCCQNSATYRVLHKCFFYCGP
jgi:hypothetical protein